jgi:hypothetical protein
MLLSNGPVQFTFQRVKNEIHFVKKQNTFFKQLQNLCACAIVHIFGVYIQLCHDTLLPKSSCNSRQEHFTLWSGSITACLGFLQMPHHFNKLEHK